jgi:hypothetical protein
MENPSSSMTNHIKTIHARFSCLRVYMTACSCHRYLQFAKLDADLRISALLGTSSIQPIHDYYPFAHEDEGRLAPKAAQLVDRLDILVAVRRFLGMGVADSRFLRFAGYVRMQHFVRRTTVFLFGVVWGMCGKNSCNAFPLLFMLTLGS